MNFNVGIIAIVVTVLLWLIGLSFSSGRLWERVRHNQVELDKEHNENRADHRQIFDKLDEMVKLIRNGHGG
jgi:hypothetical protein